MQLLELFKGTGSVGKTFKKAGYDVESVDVELKFKPTHTVDILKWDYTMAKTPDVIWASPPCNSFSYLMFSNKMRNNDTMKPLKPTAVLGDKILRRTIHIINYFKKINPKLKWIMENPHGTMWRSPILKNLGKYDTANTLYFLYGDCRKKSTDFFNNFNLKLKDPELFDSKKYKEKGKSVVDLPLAERYKIPQKLIREIIKQIKN